MGNGRNHETDNTDVLNIAAILDDMWRGMKKFYWLFLLVISISSTVFFLQAKKSYTPVYEAYSSFVVNTKTAYGYTETYYNKTTAQQMSRTFPYILTSGVLRQVVAESLGMTSVPASITAESMEDMALFTIRVRAQNPQLAYDVLQAVIANYPIVAEYIIGDTQLTLMDESGVPEAVVNPPAFTGQAGKGALAGIGLSLVFLCVYAFTRNTVRREDDLKSRISVECLGNIPLVRFKKRGNGKNQLVLVDAKESGSLLGENIRAIRTRVSKKAETQGIRKILVTSAAPEEGKTTFAINLAVSLAAKGRKVALIDADLRNPSVVRQMGLSRAENGIGEVLKGQADLKESLVSYRDTTLKILPGAEPISNPTGLIAGENMEKVLEALARTADYVIVDAPPCGIFSDASLLARSMDGAIVVVRQDYMRIERILSGIENITDTGVQVLGYVLNGTEMGITGYGYGYSYGYGYRYGYGYGRRRYGYGEKKTVAETRGEERETPDE